jgi:multidrug efflux pump
LYFVFFLALAFIYLVLSAQFESFRGPLVIMLTVPLAITGALVVMKLAGVTLNVYSQIGLVMLIGLITKNGILIVEFTNQLRDRGMAKVDALVEASCLRLRPILMTTAATVVGHFPLVLATGPGAGARNSIGIMLVSGMIIGTVFTLFVVPSIYMLVVGVRKRAVAGEDLELEPESAIAEVAPVAVH